MDDTRIILVEGMPGTGKSTVSQFVHQHLQTRGYDSYWYHEEAATHPVRLFYQPKQHRSWFDYCESVVTCWENFTLQLQERNQIAVLDAGILQNHVRSMLIFDCNRNLMLDLVSRIEKRI
ncbi:MAG: AAA family ATPase, partial [Planctomycetaceae bacterium]|nr:AAA family ATPase [Planctomycetaceae bacterium]